MNANFEEAANIATEYLSSLENLPNETQHILAEIKHREQRTQDLQDEIRKETQKYFRHSSKNAGQALSGKDAAIPDGVVALYAEMDVLASEKIALADRLVKLFERAMARLQHDLQRILKLQGEEPGLPPTQHFLNTVDNTVQQIQTSLRTATIAAAEVPPPSAPVGPPPQKKRRVTATASAGSIKLPSPVPVASGGTYTSNVSGAAQRSSLSRQVHPRHSPMRSRRVLATGPDDEDAEGEEDMDEAGEDGGDAEDKELYCYCRKLSYGEVRPTRTAGAAAAACRREGYRAALTAFCVVTTIFLCDSDFFPFYLQMIACDNEDCQYQWFHISCVNVKVPMPDTWYCDECKTKLGLNKTFTPPSMPSAATTGGGRKGRKKQ